MKRTLITLGVALSLTAGAIQGTPASAQTLEETDSSSLSSTSSGTDGGSSTGALALVATTIALGGGALWAIQQGLIPNPSPGIIPSPHPLAPAPAPKPARGDCSPQAFNDALWEWRGSPGTTVESCDGRFAWVSQDRTDWRVAFEFDGQRWNVSRPAGTTKTGMTQGCYNGIELRNKGASDDFLSRIPICTSDEIGYSPW